MTANQKQKEDIDQANAKGNEFIQINIKTLETDNLTTV
jgi:hypothetical protein